MISISDATDLAQAAYAPTAIAIISLIVIGGFLNLRGVFSGIFRKFVSTLASDVDEDPAVTQSATNQDRILRASVFLFLVLAWPPFFHSLGNLSPLNVNYSPQNFYFAADTEKLARIACARSEPLRPLDAADFVDAAASFADEEDAAAISGQSHRAFAMIGIARSLFVLFAMSLAISVLSASLRKWSWQLIVISALLIGYTGLSGFAAANNALRYEASKKTTVVSAQIADESASKVTEECISQFEDEIEFPASHGKKIWIGVGWPNFGALLPLPT